MEKLAGLDLVFVDLLQVQCNSNICITPPLVIKKENMSMSTTRSAPMVHISARRMHFWIPHK